MSQVALALVVALGSSSGCSRGDPLEGCTFHEDRQCWQCGSCDEWDRVYAACLEAPDCENFCGTCFPAGYAQCKPGSDYPPERCGGWEPPVGNLAGCFDHGGGVYGCNFCSKGWLKMGGPSTGPDGECLFFMNSCVPAGFSPVAMGQDTCDAPDGGAGG